MRAVKAQFFLCYAVMGSLLPYLPLHLESRGLTKVQVGIVLASMGVAIIVTPVLVTLLADLRVQARHLLAGMYLLGAVTLAALGRAEGFAATLAAYLLHAMAIVPTFPVQDGLFFALQRQRVERGEADEPYHRVRVWGTLGFIGPSLGLYLLMRRDGDTSWAIALAAAACVIAAVNTLLLPRVAAARPAHGDTLPTLAAARRIFSPAMLPFTIAMWLIIMATSAYYTYYPAYLVEPPVGIDKAWVGLISSIGVTIEIGFILAFGRIAAGLGMRRLLIAAAAVTTLRMTLLWLAPTAAVGVGTQAMHGVMVVLIHVAPPVLLNRYADAACRNSMQGLFAMVVYGSGRIVGNLLAAPLAKVDLSLVFLMAAGLCAAATLLLTMRYREAHDSEAGYADAG